MPASLANEITSVALTASPEVWGSYVRGLKDIAERQHEDVMPLFSEGRSLVWV